MSVVDSAMTREIFRDISKRAVDISALNVHVMHGVVYLRGRLAKLRGLDDDMDLHDELMILVKILKQKPGVRDVICEVELAGPSVIERMTPKNRAKY
jgi:hypothetical protein